jgi:hypothetical protein
MEYSPLFSRYMPDILTMTRSTLFLLKSVINDEKRLTLAKYIYDISGFII